MTDDMKILLVRNEQDFYICILYPTWLNDQRKWQWCDTEKIICDKVIPLTLICYSVILVGRVHA